MKPPLKISRSATDLLKSYYSILDTVPLKLLSISHSKNLTTKITRKCNWEAIKCSIGNMLKLCICIDKQGMVISKS